MRIQGTADLLMPTLESTASLDETADKGLFARLLNATPDIDGDTLPTVLPGKADGTKAPPLLQASEVRATVASLTAVVDTTAALAQAKAVVQVQTVLPVMESTPAALPELISSTADATTRSLSNLAQTAITGKVTTEKTITPELTVPTRKAANVADARANADADVDADVVVSEQKATPALPELVANGVSEPATLPILPTLAADTQMEPAETAPPAGPAAATSANVSLDELTARSSRTAAAPELEAATAITADQPTPSLLAAKKLQASAPQLNSSKNTAVDQAAATEPKSAPELAAPAAQKPKQVRDIHAHDTTTSAKPDDKLSISELPDSNQAPVLLTAASANDASTDQSTGQSTATINTATTPIPVGTANNPMPATAPSQQQAAASTDSTIGMTSSPVVGNPDTAALPPSASAQSVSTPPVSTQPVSTQPAELTSMLQSLQPERSINASNTDSALLRGMRMPHSGKALPPAAQAADSTDSTDQNSAQRIFKELADTTLSLNPSQATDASALQTNQNVLNAAAITSTTPGSTASDGNTALQTAGSGAAALPALNSATANAAVASSPLTEAYVMTSGLAMQSSGWGEETVHHIRWLKDHDQQSAEIQLHPAELGRMSISIDIKDGQASVQLTAASAEAKDLLEKSLPELRNLLAQSGMSLADSGVTQHKNGQQTWPNRFNPLWFESDEQKPVEISSGKPAMFRSAGGSYRIDQYV